MNKVRMEEKGSSFEFQKDDKPLSLSICCILERENRVSNSRHLEEDKKHWDIDIYLDFSYL